MKGHIQPLGRVTRLLQVTSEVIRSANQIGGSKYATTPSVKFEPPQVGCYEVLGEDREAVFGY